jgi:hypothetical protein
MIRSLVKEKKCHKICFITEEENDEKLYGRPPYSNEEIHKNLQYKIKYISTIDEFIKFYDWFILFAEKIAKYTREYIYTTYNFSCNKHHAKLYGKYCNFTRGYLKRLSNFLLEQTNETNTLGIINPIDLTTNPNFINAVNNLNQFSISKYMHKLKLNELNKIEFIKMHEEMNLRIPIICTNNNEVLSKINLTDGLYKNLQKKYKFKKSIITWLFI